MARGSSALLARVAAAAARKWRRSSLDIQTVIPSEVEGSALWVAFGFSTTDRGSERRFPRKGQDLLLSGRAPRTGACVISILDFNILKGQTERSLHPLDAILPLPRDRRSRSAFRRSKSNGGADPSTRCARSG